MKKIFPTIRRNLIRIIAVLVVSGALIVFSSRFVSALTKTFTQSNWTGGADTVSTVDESHILDWNKYYSATSGVDTSQPNSVKLKLELSQP